MAGVMNDRTTSVSNSSRARWWCPSGPMTRRSLTTIEHMVSANTRPAAVTTLPVPPIARMMPVFRPRVDLLFEPGHQQQVVVRSDRQQDDDRHGKHHPVQFDAEDVLPDQHRDPERRAPSDSATVPTITSAATRLLVMQQHDQEDQADRRDSGDQRVMLRAVRPCAPKVAAVPPREILAVLQRRALHNLRWPRS